MNFRRIYTLLFGWMPYKCKRFLFELWYTFSPVGRVSNKGERWVAGSWDELIGSKDFYSIQHAHRYYWAGQMLEGQKDVLDVGCGSGYGSWYLASKGHSVVGYDPSEKAIVWANRHFKHKNLSFTTSDSKLGTYDVIVSFEVIEHVGEGREKERREWVKFLCSLLREGGQLIISTPNASKDNVHSYLSSQGHQLKRNPFHYELTEREFEDILVLYFNKVEMNGQGLVEVYDFKEYAKSMNRTDVELKDFEIRNHEMCSCPIIVTVCKELRADE